MLVGEIVIRKDYLKFKIAETEDKLSALKDMDIEPQRKGALYSSYIDILFNLYSKLQSHKALLDSENAKTEMSVGESTLTVLDAVHIRETFKRKVDILTSVIDSLDNTVDYTDLVRKRDTLMEEYISLCRGIKTSDWSKDVE